jgi:hypothetical protein
VQYCDGNPLIGRQRSLTLGAVRTPRQAAVVFGTLIGAVLTLIVPGASVAASTADVLIDPGPGWTLVSEQPGNNDSLVRGYKGAAGGLVLIAFPVTTPPGIRSTFDLLVSMAVRARLLWRSRSPSLVISPPEQDISLNDDPYGSDYAPSEAFCGESRPGRGKTNPRSNIRW